MTVWSRAREDEARTATISHPFGRPEVAGARDNTRSMYCTCVKVSFQKPDGYAHGVIETCAHHSSVRVISGEGGEFMWPLG